MPPKKREKEAQPPSADAARAATPAPAFVPTTVMEVPPKTAAMRSLSAAAASGTSETLAAAESMKDAGKSELPPPPPPPPPVAAKRKAASLLPPSGSGSVEATTKGEQRHSQEDVAPHSFAQPPDVEYVSPVKRLKTVLNMQRPRVIDTVESLRAFISSNDTTNRDVCGTIRIRARLLWIAPDIVKGIHILRLYMGEERVPEPLEQQQQTFQEAQYLDPYGTNKYLITTSLIETYANHPRLPRPGNIVVFTPTKLQLYHDCCQADSKIYMMNTVGSEINK